MGWVSTGGSGGGGGAGGLAFNYDLAHAEGDRPIELLTPGPLPVGIYWAMNMGSIVTLTYQFVIDAGWPDVVTTIGNGGRGIVVSDGITPIAASTGMLWLHLWKISV
jgi:hypothetical protein